MPRMKPRGAILTYSQSAISRRLIERRYPAGKRLFRKRRSVCGCFFSGSRSCHFATGPRMSRGCMYLRRLVRICSNTPGTSVQTLAPENVTACNADLPPVLPSRRVRIFLPRDASQKHPTWKNVFLFDVASAAQLCLPIEVIVTCHCLDPDLQMIPYSSHSFTEDEINESGVS